MEKVNKAWKSFDKGFKVMNEVFKEFESAFSTESLQSKKKSYAKYVITKIGKEPVLLQPKTWYLTINEKWSEFIDPAPITGTKINFYQTYEDAEKQLNKMFEGGHNGIYSILTVYKK